VIGPLLVGCVVGNANISEENTPGGISKNHHQEKEKINK